MCHTSIPKPIPIIIEKSRGYIKRRGQAIAAGGRNCNINVAALASFFITYLIY